jgi:hypothetical protein
LTIPPSTGDKTTLLDLGEAIIEAWSAGSTDEYYDLVTDTWMWNDTEAGSDSDKSDWKMGLSALAAVIYRFKRPRDVAFRNRYRDYAIRSVDAFFRDHQDDATGGIFRTSAANVAGDSGTATFMALANIGIVVACLNHTRRWEEQILAALDYTTGRGELTYYTNGNFMLYKLLAYDLGARVSGEDPARRQVVEDLWEFAYTPTEAVGDPTKWRGIGFHDEGDDVGYFSEVSSTGATTDYSAANVFDAIYTNAQASFAAVGYLLSGDPRYALAARQTTGKMLPLYNAITNQFSYTGGSRNTGAITRNVDNPYIPTSVWVLDRSDLADRIDVFINHADNGLDTDYRRYLNQTHATFVRGFGLVVGAVIVAAHGRSLTHVGFGWALPARMPESTGTTKYVATTGNDTTGNGSIGNPYATINKGIQALSAGAGGIVYVRGGTYPAQMENWNRPGSATNPVTVAAYNGEVVTVTGRVEIQESYFRARGITFSGGDGTNPLFYVQQHSGVPASHIEVDQCIIENSAADGVFLEGNASASTRVDDFQIHRSIIRNNGTDTSLEHGFYPKWATNAVMSDCLLYGNAAAQLHIGNACDGAIVANTTAISEGGIETAVIWSESTGERSDNNRIVNTLLVQMDVNKDAFETTWGSGSAGTGNAIDKTFAWRPNGGTGSAFNTAAGGVTVVRSSTSDPMFVDLNNGDYRVLAASPAVGYADLAFMSEFDLNGDRRISGVVGAYGIPA